MTQQERAIVALYAALDALLPVGAPTWVEPRAQQAATVQRVQRALRK